MGLLRGLSRAAVAGGSAYLAGKRKGKYDKDEADERARKTKFEEGEVTRKSKLEESREARDTRLDALRESLLGAQTRETEAQTRYYESGAGLRDRTDPDTRAGRGANASLERDKNYRKHFADAKKDGMSDTDAANYARVRVGLAPVRAGAGDALDRYIQSKSGGTAGVKK